MNEIKKEAQAAFQFNKREVETDKADKGFTLIELMVVILIIGILSALAVPRMYNVTAKAKASEAPQVIGTWESLQAAFVHENSSAGDFLSIGFQDPTVESKWFDYNDGGASIFEGSIIVVVRLTFGNCNKDDNFVSKLTVSNYAVAHSTPIGICGATYTPNF